MTLTAIAILICISLFGIRSLLVFSSRNGLLEQLEKLTTSGKAPNGKPLRVLTTNGAFPALDKQLNAVCVFFLLYCEDWAIPETSLAGLNFTGAWGASWALIMLDSMRAYSQKSLLAWISIPGILIFNYSHAMITPLYLAYRVAFTPTPSPNGLLIGTNHLAAFPWAWGIGYCTPIILLMLPDIDIKGYSSKHTLAGWYQQWNLFISLCQYLLSLWWETPGLASQSKNAVDMVLLRTIYRFIFAMAAIAHWIPLIAAAAAVLLPIVSGKQRLRFVHPWTVLFPASPFSNRKAENVSEGGRWLIQWDVITGTAATIVWAATLYMQAWNAVSTTALPIFQLAQHALWWGLVGGPMGVPVALLWWRDELLLKLGSPSWTL